MKNYSWSAALAVAAVLAGCGQSSDSTPPGAVEAKPAAAAVKAYTLEKCVVSDEKLGSMGDPIIFVHNGQEIKLCCKDCRKDFDKDPDKYLAKLAAK